MRSANYCTTGPIWRDSQSGNLADRRIWPIWSTTQPSNLTLQPICSHQIPIWLMGQPGGPPNFLSGKGVNLAESVQTHFPSGKTTDFNPNPEISAPPNQNYKPNPAISIRNPSLRYSKLKQKNVRIPSHKAPHELSRPSVGSSLNSGISVMGPEAYDSLH